LLYRVGVRVPQRQCRGAMPIRERGEPRDERTHPVQHFMAGPPERAGWGSAQPAQRAHGAGLGDRLIRRGRSPDRGRPRALVMPGLLAVLGAEIGGGRGVEGSAAVRAAPGAVAAEDVLDRGRGGVVVGSHAASLLLLVRRGVRRRGSRAPAGRAAEAAPRLRRPPPPGTAGPRSRTTRCRAPCAGS